MFSAKHIGDRRIMANLAGQ